MSPSEGLQRVQRHPCGITSGIFSQNPKIGHLRTDPGAITDMGYHCDAIRGLTGGPETPLWHNKRYFLPKNPEYLPVRRHKARYFFQLKKKYLLSAACHSASIFSDASERGRFFILLFFILLSMLGMVSSSFSK